MAGKLISDLFGETVFDKSACHQYATMPQSATTGTIVQYVGTTTADYTNGYFYKWNGTAWVSVTPSAAEYTAGDGIDITDREVSVKVGEGLFFDSNDAVCLNAATRNALAKIPTLESDVDEVKEDLIDLTNTVNSVISVNNTQNQRLDKNEKEISNLKEASKGTTWSAQQGTSPAYTDTVPANAQKYAELAKVGCKSVVWNELIKNGNFLGTTEWNGTDGSLISANDNVLSVTQPNPASSTSWGIGVQQYLSIPTDNHKYYASIFVKSPYSQNIGVAVGSYNADVNATANVWTELSFILTHNNSAISRFWVQTDPRTWQSTDQLQIKTAVFCDLTQMFGAGNEPSQLTDERIAFIKAYALANPAYNVGAIVSGKCDKVVTKKANTTQIAEYAIPAAVQALNGYGESAGTAYNYVDFNTKKFVKKVGKVDLGTLTWVYRSVGGQHFFLATDLEVLCSTSWGTSALPNVLCSNYTSNKLWKDVTIENGDKNCSAYDNQVRIADSAYTDAATFKNAMSGVYLYYELAIPVETDISAYISDDNFIETEAGGTVTFHQQNDTLLPIYNEVNYMIKL